MYDGNGDTRFNVGASNESMRILSGGNVGIGTTAPSAKLDVRGQTYINNGTSNALFIDTTVADNNTRDAIYLFEDDSAASGRQAISWYNGNQLYYKARLWTEVGGGYASTTFGIDVADNSRTVATRLVINNGNVGIGTTSPGQALTLGANKNVRLDWGGGTDTTLEMFYDSSYRMGLKFQGNDRMLTLYNYRGDGANTDLVLKNGNVGIGTTAPGNLLHVAGQPRFDSVGSAPADISAPVTQNKYYGTNSVVLTSPNTWLKVSINGTDYVIPAYSI
jgi:hypothetical protein